MNEEYSFILGLLTGTCLGLFIYHTVLENLSKKANQ